MLLLHPEHISSAPNNKNANQLVKPATCTILSVLYASTFFFCGLFFAILSVMEECIHSGNTAKFAKNKKGSLTKTVELLNSNNAGLAANG